MVVCWGAPVVDSALHCAGIVARPGPRWMGLHPGSSLRSATTNLSTALIAKRDR